MANLKSTIVEGNLRVTNDISENGTPLSNKYLALTGGTLNGNLEINATGSSYQEGVRIHPASNDWCAMVLCDTTNTGSSGVTANTWGIFNNDGNFSIAKGGSHTANPSNYLKNINGAWTLYGSGDTTITANGNIELNSGDQNYISAQNSILLEAYKSELNSGAVRLELNDDEYGNLSVYDSGGSGGAYREILRVNDDDITYKGNSLRHYRHNIYLRFSNIVISTHFYSSSASAVSKSTFAQNIVYNSDYYPRGIWATGFTVDSEENTSTPNSNYSGWIYVDSDGYLHLLRPNGSITDIDNFSFSDSVTEV